MFWFQSRHHRQQLYLTQRGSATAIHGRHSHYTGDAQRNTDVHRWNLTWTSFWAARRVDLVGFFAYRCKGQSLAISDSHTFWMTHQSHQTRVYSFKQPTKKSIGH